MSNWNLFPDENEAAPPLMPAADRPDPVVWVRRLVIVEHRIPGADVTPIREIGFRRGLNIIRTAEPRPGGRRSAGHSVGKTLLVRLIRYCLGEPHYAPDAILRRIARALPDAWVLLEAEVAGQLWSVARPIGGDRPADSFAVRGRPWRALMEEDGEREKFGAFVETLEAAALGGHVSHLILPHADRAIRWQDVLAWMSRDQRCRYANSHSWRHPDSGSGVADLHHEDASLVMRTVMGLLGGDEAELIMKHQSLLSQRAEAKRATERLEPEIVFLARRIRGAVSDAADLPDGPLLPSTVEQKVTSVVRFMEDELSTLRAAGIGATDSARQEARDRAGEAAGRVEQLKAERKLVEGERKTSETAGRDDLLASLGGMALACESPDCPRRETGRSAGTPDPEREAVLRELDRRIGDLNQRLTAAQQAASAARETLSKAEAAYEAAIQEHRQRESELEQGLARYRVVRERAEELKQLYDDLESSHQKIERLDGEVDASLEGQKQVRSEFAAKHERLNAMFDAVVKAMLGPDAGGEIVVEARSFRPTATNETAAAGDAIGTSALVLGFDLACLRASSAGLGLFPRLLIHDSPREADLERQIYDHLFEIIIAMEKASDTAPNFQYIITTTTPPPNGLDEERYVCLNLDGQDDTEMLLKRRV